MKRSVLVAALAISASLVQAADVPGSPAKMRAETNQPAATAPPKPKVTETPVKPLKRAITYGGLLPDLRNSKNPRKVFDLRTPLQEVSGEENLSYYPRSEHVQGVVFFSLKF